MSWDRWSPTSPRVMTISPVPSAGLWPAWPAPIFVLRHPFGAFETARSGRCAGWDHRVAHRRPRGGPRPGESRGLGLGSADGPARHALDWETQINLSINPDKARIYRDLSRAKDDQCTMCGRFCAMKVFDERFDAGEK